LLIARPKIDTFPRNCNQKKGKKSLHLSRY